MGTSKQQIVFLKNLLNKKYKQKKKMRIILYKLYKNIQKATKIREKIYYKNIYQISVLNTSNNTHITLMQYKTKYVIAKASSGSTGYKRLEKSTKFAAYKTALKIVKKAKKRGILYAIIKIKGQGRSFKTIRNLLNKNFKTIYLLDNNKYAHNGCKLRKKARK